MEITDYTDEKLKMIMNQYAARRARKRKMMKYSR